MLCVTKRKGHRNMREIQLSTSQCCNKPHFTQGHASKQSGCQSNWCSETLRGTSHYWLTLKPIEKLRLHLKEIQLDLDVVESQIRIDPLIPALFKVVFPHSNFLPLEEEQSIFEIPPWLGTWQRVYLGSMPRVSYLSSSSSTPRLSSLSSWKTRGH